MHIPKRNCMHVCHGNRTFSIRAFSIAFPKIQIVCNVNTDIVHQLCAGLPGLQLPPPPPSAHKSILLVCIVKHLVIQVKFVIDRFFFIHFFGDLMHM